MWGAVLVGFAGLMAAVPDGSHDEKVWSLQWVYNQNGDQYFAGELYRPTQSTLTLHRLIGERARAGIGHDYRVLSLPAVGGIPADTNGHLHQLGAGWRLDTHDRRYWLATGLAVSSNALKHPSDLESDDVRFAGAVEQRLGESWRVALLADDRFGRFRLYPGFELLLHPTPAQEVRLGFPESSWRWHWAHRLRFEFAVFPDGGRWRVRDATLERHSIVRLSSWRAALGLSWQPLDLLEVKAQVGRTFETALRYQLRDGSQTHVSPADATFFGIALHLRL
jgi:hypothetical protein